MEREILEDGIRFVKDGKEAAAIHETIDEEKKEVIVTLSGSLTGETANDLLDELNALVIAGCGIRVDAGKVDYMAASMGNVFLNTENKLEEQNKYLKIVNLPVMIYEEWKKRGLHDLLDVEVAG